MSKFKSFAKQANFREYQLTAPDESAKIRQETARMTRGMQRAQSFLEENNALYLQAQKFAQNQESLQREQNFKLETENRKAYRDALKRDYDIQTQNDRAAAETTQQNLKQLSAFSESAFKLYADIENNITERDTKANRALAAAAGADLETVTAIQALGDSITKAEFQQQDFILDQLAQGKNIDDLWALYSNRNTRNFVNNITVAQNTAYTYRDQLGIALHEAGDMTPEEQKIFINKFTTEFNSNVAPNLNPDLVGQYITPIVRSAQTKFLGAADRQIADSRKQQLQNDRLRSIENAYRDGGIEKILSLMSENPSQQKWNDLGLWAQYKSQDQDPETGLNSDQLYSLIHSEYKGQDFVTSGKKTTIALSRGMLADGSKLIELYERRKQNERTNWSNSITDQNIRAEKGIQAILNQAIEQKGRLDQEDIQAAEAYEKKHGSPGYQSPALAEGRTKTLDARAEAQLSEEFDAKIAAGTFGINDLTGVTTNYNLMKKYMPIAKEMEALRNGPEYKKDVEMIKGTLVTDNRIASVKGASSKDNYTVTLKQDEYIRKYKELLAKTGNHADARNQVISEINTYLAGDVIDAEGRFKDVVEQVKASADESKLSLQNYNRLISGHIEAKVDLLADPKRLVDTYLDSGYDAGSMLSMLDEARETGKVPTHIENITGRLGVTPLDYINALAEGSGQKPILLDSRMQQIKDSLPPLAKRLFNTYRTSERYNRGMNVATGTPPPVRPIFAMTAPASYGTPSQRAALNAIAANESGNFGYDAVNQGGSADGKKALGFSGRYSQMPTARYKMPLTEMTLGQILQEGDPRFDTLSTKQFQDAGGIHAVGRYQFVHDTLKALVERHDLPLNAKFTPQLQDYLAISLNNSSGSGQWVGPTATQRDIIEAGRNEQLGEPPLTF